MTDRDFAGTMEAPRFDAVHLPAARRPFGVNVTTAPVRRLLSRGLVRRLAHELLSLRSDLESRLADSGNTAWDAGRRSLAKCLDRDTSTDESADVFAQAIVCTRALAEQHAPELAACRDWFLAQAEPWERLVLEESLRQMPDVDSSSTSPKRQRRKARPDETAIDSQKSYQTGSDDSLPLIHLYEHLLRQDQPDRRKRAGVFYTPRPIVRFMVRQIDRQLTDEFDLPLGIADSMNWGEIRRRRPALQVAKGTSADEPFVRLFDPAVGTGAFLLEVIDQIHDKLALHESRNGATEEQIDACWNDYVPRSLLPRLLGMELLPAPCYLARLHVALKLAQSGYRFGEPRRIEIHLGNTLAGPTAPLLRAEDRGPGRQAASGTSQREVPYDIPFTVVLGNPPFSYLSENQSDWITSLVRGEEGHAGYFEADGQKLGERKTWLHDDYVKFIRYAQWRIETTGCGIVALVTNRGYLGNATFRILRRQMLRAFPQVTVIDLHGSRKAREVPPDGSHDENVFGLDQGVAIGFFRRLPGIRDSSVNHAELWGSRSDKFRRLDGGTLDVEPLRPAPPEYRFTPGRIEMPPEYASGPLLADVFQVHSSAPVTARDGFVVAFSRAELARRIEAFCDLSIPDDEIRRRFFTHTRSARYALGDTRGWKLHQARRTLAAESNWESFIQPCQYRPLDWRWIFWHPAMIDWPRVDVTEHLLTGRTETDCQVREYEGEGVRGKDETLLSPSHPHPPPLSHPIALIARRQTPPTEPCTYFWVTSALTLDGIIRNDNCGSESLFVPSGGARFPTCPDPQVHLANEGKLADPIDLAHYIYALFHSPTYRSRYAAALRSDFPRVLVPHDFRLASALAALGKQLVALHAQRPPVARDGVAAYNSQRLLVAVAPRFPQYASGRVWIRDDYSVAALDEFVWQFRVGAHQVARKWLADRRGRPLTAADLAWYGVILDTIGRTRELMTAIDGVIAKYGSFPQAFRGDG